ncbi:DUF6932 family protein [uncultured Sphaerochaeta sp.]|uniref:DUF6932 family protein n=1 Tax=uncultured Sphaerochaeta sp. TaxID=886478 RepID=UPI002A0A6681|nr:hypothetical protein [uncultured Sphaerochaeta sp.]
MSFSPLFSPGFNDIEDKSLEKYFLNGFPGSKTRSQLIEGLKIYISALKNYLFTYEIWIDGSFVTNKMDPGDIDLLVLFSSSDYNSLSSSDQRALVKLLDNYLAKQSFGCDVYFCVLENEKLKSYWRGWFGFDRRDEPKGIARIRVNI